MSQVLKLDNVIRLIKKVKDIDSLKMKDAKLVRLDADKEVILEKKPLITIGRDLKYYWISHKNRGKNDTESKVEDFSSGKSVVIKIKYEVRCKKGNEEKAALALFKGNNPGAALNEFIDDHVQDYADSKRKEGVNPVMDYFKFKNDLKEHLGKKVLEDVGLTAEFNLKLKYEDELKEFAIHSDYFPVRVKDCDDELSLKFETGLGILEKNKIHAILNYTELDKLESALRRQIKEFVLEKVLLHDFVYNLNKEVRTRINPVLNKVIADKGREISWITFHTNRDSKHPPQSLQISHLSKCSIKDYKERIEVGHKLLMALEDIGKYRAADISEDLEDWVKEKLDGVAGNVLFEKRYVDILLDFDQKEEHREIFRNIVKEMKKIADSIGYTIKHLIVDPDLEPLKIKRDGFNVEDKEYSYATHDNRVDIKLGIVATGRIKDLGEISKLLIPGESLQEEMRQAIRLEVQKEMHEVYPEEFYMPSDFSENEPVELRLRKGITEKLKGEFSATAVVVVIKVLETDLIIRAKELISGSPYRFEIDVLPHRGGGHREVIEFDVEYLIKNVNKSSWQTFLLREKKSTEEEIEEINATLAKDIIAKFQKIPADVLLTTSVGQSNQLLDVARLSHSKVEKVFGLEVYISLLSRKATILEQTNLQILEKQVEAQYEKEVGMIKIRDDADLENLKYLQEKKKELLDPDFIDDEAREEIEKEIKKLGAKSAHPSEKGKSLLKPDHSQPGDDWSFDQFTDEFKDEGPPAKDKTQKELKTGDHKENNG
jgi:hypothetical protein